jgi:hypothetical protein
MIVLFVLRPAEWAVRSWPARVPAWWPDAHPLYPGPAPLPFLKTLGGHRRYPAAEIRQLAEQLQVQPTA